MPKISATNNKSLFIKFAIKSLLSSALSVVLLSLLSSAVFLKLDIDLKYAEYVSFAICAAASFVTAYACMMDFKSNYLLMSVLSSSILVIFTIINSVVNKNSLAMTIIRIAVILLSAILAALFKTVRKRR